MPRTACSEHADKVRTLLPHMIRQKSSDHTTIANIMSLRSLKEVSRAIQAQFTTTKAPTSLPPELRQLLQQFVYDHEDAPGSDVLLQVNPELKSLWEKCAADDQNKLGAFAGVLWELHAAMSEEERAVWWRRVIKPLLNQARFSKAALEDAKEFTMAVMVPEEDDETIAGQATATDLLCRDLLDMYVMHSRSLDDNEDSPSLAKDTQVAQQIEDVALAFGRKRPKYLFHHLDDLVKTADTRLQALTLLSSFLRLQTPHLYLVINTPLVEDLLKCLMNDTSTTILSVALTSLIMLLPHIPGSLAPYLPRLFLVYSRLLCWEKFSPLSTEAQRNLVTDDRLPGVDDDDEQLYEDVGIDASWEIARPDTDIIEASTPELLTYFTYLYGLYPLNFMSYIRKPRRYLKDIDFPGADAFDLDQAVIRSRTEQFRQVHLVHPNFYHMTVEEELSDPKWPKMDPADVVGECHGLCINTKSALARPGPPPTGRLPEIPPVPPLNPTYKPGASPTTSHVSVRSGTSWRDTQSTARSTSVADGDSPILKPQVAPADDDLEKIPAHLEDNLAYLQRELTLMKNNLNFERWHKAQYSEYIGQIMRRNVKEATAEAETLNLIHANRALKKQLEQMRKSREATMKDSALTRKQANSLENNLTERFNKFKQEQETWQADADELRRLREEVGQYRELLVATEARELNKSHELRLAQQDLEKLQKLQTQLKQAQRKVNEYQYREFDFDKTKRESEIMKRENEELQLRIQRLEQEHSRLRQAYTSKIAELELQVGLDDTPSRSSGSQSGPDVQAIIQQAVAGHQEKLIQLKKAYTRLLEKHTDLELEYQSLKSRFDLTSPGGSHIGGGSFYSPGDDQASMNFDLVSDYIPYESNYATNISASAPSSRHHFSSAPSSTPSNLPAQTTPGSDQTVMHSQAGLMFDRPLTSRKNSSASKSSSQPAAFNRSLPLGSDEGMSAFSDFSGNGSQTGKREKIQADSTVRVYGRGVSLNFCFYFPFLSTPVACVLGVMRGNALN